ncbi:methyltransferase [Saccharomonospora sp. CUA-673]|uniref:HemK2/MTQ2 family protein methyltransferase n=1 Tax=Saccharomonospora sp. CUA-673 TaxID=1904969 RepID=UPI00095E3954|nr:HemK2/MTQ2 family protein methyltransferase [Saccharomonospora sp. CUA-673]OLT40066.1 methyltransferase [Saccharomonospora sp. CUA-673]
MRILRVPGVYCSQGDTWLLRRALQDARLPAARRVLDIGTGTGALALAAAAGGAQDVTAVDVSPAARLNARLNAWAHGLPVRVLPGDALSRDYGRPFDLVLANPPYVPAESGQVPTRGRARAWDAGGDGRAIIDRLCDRVPDLVAPRGSLLMVQSELADVDATLLRLRGLGMKAAVVDRQVLAFGPVLRGRREMLHRNGFLAPDQRHEELVVIRADRAE